LLHFQPITNNSLNVFLNRKRARLQLLSRYSSNHRSSDVVVSGTSDEEIDCGSDEVVKKPNTSNDYECAPEDEKTLKQNSVYLN
jgi:hypothetical protein